MKEFDYDLDYKTIDFSVEENRKLYRIGRRARSSTGSPYTDDIVLIGDLTPEIAVKSSNKIFAMYLDYRDEEDFIGMDMCRKFLEMGLPDQGDMPIIEMVKSMIKKAM